MAQYGALTSYGQLSYGAGPTHAKRLYLAMRNAQAAFSFEEGSHVEASTFARARALASARRYVLSAYEQKDPRTATYGLDKLEADYGMTPAPGDTLDERRRAVLLKRAVQKGPSRPALETALRAFLGDGFVAILYPEDPGAPQGPFGFERPELPHGYWTLETEVATTGADVAVAYATLGPHGVRIKAGDRLYVQTNALASYDPITVSAVDDVLGTFTATFGKVHPIGAPIVTHAPFYLIGWRNVRVGLTSAVLADQRSVRQVRDYLERALRAVTTFQLIPGSLTPFTIESVVPLFAIAGAGDVPVDIIGIDLPLTGILKIDGIECATFWESDVLVHATIPAAITSVPGYKSLRIVDGVRLSNAYTWAVNFPVPTLSSVTPAFVFVLEGEQDMLAMGSGFAPSGTAPRFDAAPGGYVAIDTTQATIRIPASSVSGAGVRTVRMVNPAPGGGTSEPVDIEVRFRAPSLLALSQTSIIRGRNPGPVAIAGTDDGHAGGPFYLESIVKVDGVVVPSTFASRFSLLFTFPAGMLDAGGVLSVTVENPTTGGGGGVSNALAFTSIVPALIAIDISEVPQYFDGFDVQAIVENADANFAITYNHVVQPTTVVDAQHLVAHVTSAACAVPGTTMVRAKDLISGLSTNALVFEVHEWDPLSLGVTLRLWLDPSSLVDDGTGKVAQWNDKSGGGRHCLPVTAGQLPLIVPSSTVLNGQRTARFSGSPICNLSYTPWLVSGAAGVVNEDKYTIWVVAATMTLGFGQCTLGDFYGYITVATTSNGPPVQDLVGLDSSGASTYVRTPLTWYPAPTPFVIRQRKTPTQFAARVKRDAEVVVAHAGNVAAFDPSNVYVGSASKTGGAWLGEMAEVVICDTDVNSTHKAMMDNRFSYIYGLPFGSGVGKPAITSLAPPVCSQYDLPFWLYANNSGAGYTATSVINIGDTPLATEFISATQIRARIPASALATPKGLAITVADAGGISAPTGLAVLPYVDVPGLPNLYTVEPSTARQHRDPLAIRVRGSGFTASSVIESNGVSLATTQDGADLLATVPATHFDVLPGPIISVTDPAGDSPNSLEITLTPWSPLLIPFLTGLWAADDVLVVDGKISQWNDKTGRGKHFTQTDVTKQAVYIASDAAFNGKPSAHFDGINDQYSGAAAFTPLGTGNSVFAAVYRYLVVDGAGGPTQPYVNDVMFHGGHGIAAHLSPLTLIGYSTDGSTYRSAANAGLVVNQTQRCQLRVTSLALTLEIGATATAPTTLPSISAGSGAGFLIGYVSFGTNNAMSGKIAVFCTTNAAWSAEDSIGWKNWCRYHYGTTA